MTNINQQRILAQQEITAKHLANAKRFIWVRFQKEGIHCYPAAGTEPELAEVAFLAAPHRHMFHFEVQIEVHHNDRDIEFILFKRWCESLYSNGTLELNSKSCEMMSDELYVQIAKSYPGRNVTIKVSEDQENGCTIEYIV